MKLNAESKKLILDLWEERVCKSLPEARKQGKLELLNHLPRFIDRLFAALKKEDYKPEIKDTRHVSKIHGQQRSEIDNYSLAEVLREYSILRFTVLEVLGKDSELGYEDQLIIHKLVDEAKVIAGTEFSENRMTIDESLNKELKRSNAELERFAAIAAHDLRAPIATIIGYIDIVQEAFENPSDEIKKSFKAMQLCSERMLLLIERLLSYARLGHTPPNIETIDLNKIIADVLLSLGDTMNSTDAKVHYKNLPIIKGDSAIVHQLFQNLIGNSIKFKSEKPPVITIALEDENEREWTLSVTDNGIGFDPKQSESIFEPFKQLNNTSEYQGSGLGLATVKRVVDLLGGEIWCESKSGAGAKFIFTISKNPNSN